MSETAQSLPETLPSADALSDLLSAMHLAGSVLFRAEFREPWSVMSPDSVQLSGLLPVRSRHVIPFHVIASGSCRLVLPGQPPVRLVEGDAVLLPYGHAHELKGEADIPIIPIGGLLPTLPWTNPCVVRYGGAGALTSIICGYVQCDELLFHPVLRHLPALLHVSPDGTPADAWLASTIRHTATEAIRALPGSRSMLPRLTELMFVEILRKHMLGLSANEVGWFAAFKDPVAGAALRRLHAEPLRDWSVERLAGDIGVSRTVLAKRFKHFLAQPPMQYLAGWRLQLAAQEMKSSGLPMKTIAVRSGYESEPAFNRAFKRQFGLPPGVWRKQQMQP